jgi:hypothetical protein
MVACYLGVQVEPRQQGLKSLQATGWLRASPQVARVGAAGMAQFARAARMALIERWVQMAEVVVLRAQVRELVRMEVQLLDPAVVLFLVLQGVVVLARPMAVWAARMAQVQVQVRQRLRPALVRAAFRGYLVLNPPSLTPGLDLQVSLLLARYPWTRRLLPRAEGSFRPAPARTEASVAAGLAPQAMAPLWAKFCRRQGCCERSCRLWELGRLGQREWKQHVRRQDRASQHVTAPFHCCSWGTS